jgi:cytochrome P450
MSDHKAASHYLDGKVRITSFVEVDEILRNPEFAAGQTETESLPFRGRTLLELDGEEHKERRKLETRLFTKQMLDYYESDVLAPAIERCIKEAADEGRGSDGIVRADLAQLGHKMFLQIAAAVIGLDGVDTPERTKLLEECMYALNAGFDVKYATREHAEVIKEGLEAKARFAEYFYRPSALRRKQLLAELGKGEIAESDLPQDLLTILLRNHSEDWDADLPVRETLLYLAGGTDTTSNAVNHAIAELHAWLLKHPQDKEHLEDREFLRGVCNEALRLKLNVTALVRRASREIRLSTGRVVEAGQFVALEFLRANRDPGVFGRDAESFNPRRKVSPKIRPYGLAFGAGRHLCMGFPLITPVTGDSERALFRIVRALLAAGVELDPERAPQYAPTVEEVYASLPILLRAR